MVSRLHAWQQLASRVLSYALSWQRPADWPAGPLLSSLVAVSALLITFLITYGLAAFFAGTRASSAAGAQVMRGWFQAGARNPLVDVSQNTLYVFVATLLGLALLGAVLYVGFEPRWRLPDWAKGSILAGPLWLISVMIVLPLAGGGFLGVGLGAGPLPMLGLLLIWLAFGFAFAAVYGPAGDSLLGPATDEERLAAGQTMQTGGRGVLIGGLLGLVVGLVVGPVASSPGGPLWLPPVGLMLVCVLVGGALGMLVGSFAGLPVTAVAAAAAAEPALVPVEASIAVSVPPTPAGVLAGLRQLRVVAANGVCLSGYRVGDRFACTSSGELSPGLCPAAAQALKPLVAAMVQGKPDAPRAVACPMYDHMLVFQLDSAPA